MWPLWRPSPSPASFMSLETGYPGPQEVCLLTSPLGGLRPSLAAQAPVDNGPGPRGSDLSLGAGEGPGQGPLEVTLMWADQSHCVEGTQEWQGTCPEAGGFSGRDEGGGVRTLLLFYQQEQEGRVSAGAPRCLAL